MSCGCQFYQLGQLARALCLSPLAKDSEHRDT